MVGMNQTSLNAAARATDAYAKAASAGKTENKKTENYVETIKKAAKSSGIVTDDAKLGKVIGEPKLSETAQKYYDSLKKKYGNYDFILVSKDQMDAVKANPSKYGNSLKSVVLIDEEKIERMATDENYRKKYEGILSGATAQLEKMKAQIESSGASVSSFGMTVNKDGTTSFFATLKKSSADQKARIEKRAIKNKIEKKLAAKKAEKAAEKKKAEEKRLEGKDSSPIKNDDEQSFTADSLEELMTKISDWSFNQRSNEVQTESELSLGQNIDFKG